MKNQKKLDSLNEFKIKETKMTDIKGMGFACKDLGSGVWCCGTTTYRKYSSGSWMGIDCD